MKTKQNTKSAGLNLNPEKVNNSTSPGARARETRKEIRLANAREHGEKQKASNASALVSEETRRAWAGHPAREALRAREAITGLPARDFSRWSQSPRVASSALLRGLYRRADAWASLNAARWVFRNCRKAGKWQTTEKNHAWRGSEAGAVDSLRVAIIGGRWEEGGELSQSMEEITAAFRAEVLALVPSLLRYLLRFRRAEGARAAIVARFVRKARKNAYKAACKALYGERGRDGRVTCITSPLSSTVHRGSEASDADALNKLRGDALLSLLGEGVPCLKSVPSSNPQEIHAGGYGRRSDIEAEIHRVIARARAEIRKKIAKAASGGRGAQASADAARKSSAIIHHLETAMRGGRFSDEIVESFQLGPQGGFGETWKKKNQRFRKFAGIPKGGL